MNFITRTLLPLFLLTSLGNSIRAMDQQIALCKNMNTQEVIHGIKGLPQELKRHIISFLIHTYIFNFQLSKTIDIGYSPCSLAFSPEGENFLTAPRNPNFLDYFNIQSEERLKYFKEPATEISSFAFSSDGKTLLTGSKNEGEVYAWSSKTGEFLKTFLEHTACITSLAFSPHGETVLTGAEDATACLWDTKTGELLITLKEHTDRITSVAFSPDGETCLTGSYDTTACLWNSKTGELIKVFKKYKKWNFTSRGHTHPILSLAFSPDGKSFLTGSSDSTACVWDIKTGEVIKTLQGHTKCVDFVAFSKTGKICLTGSSKTARIWDASTGNCLTIFGTNATSELCNVTTKTEGFVSTFFRYSISGVVLDMSLQLNQQMRELGGIHATVIFSPDGETCLIGSDDGKVGVWKRIYDFTSVTKNEKDGIFKQLFMIYYPILHNTPNAPAKEKEVEHVGEEISTDEDQKCTIS